MKHTPNLVNRWISFARSSRTLKFAAVDGLALGTCLWLAFAIRFDFQIPESHSASLLGLIPILVAVKLLVFYCFRQLHVLPDFYGIRELLRLIPACGYASLTAGLVDGSLQMAAGPHRSVFVLDFLLSLYFLGGIRLALRLRRERLRLRRKQSNAVPATAVRQPRRIGIVGAGEAGVILARELRTKRGLGMEPVLFFDDDRRKWDASVCGIPVVGSPEILLTDARSNLRLDEVVISMPSAPARRIRQVIDILRNANLVFRTVPSLAELILGKVPVSQLRSVEVEDLLGRPPIELATSEIHDLISGRTVLVTGAGGSIGSELCRQISGFNPERLVLVERSEAALFTIEQELIAANSGGRIHCVVTDILDRPRMRRLFAELRPEIVFHAAAHKHVPMMESQPAEAIRNNTLGTAQLAEMAIEFGVERFVLISTDKAINPTSVMGATKRLAEIFLQSMHAANPTATRFMAVRFGNVLGSSGSVIPIFKKQIAAGGPVRVTHPEMTRYFMTIPEAVGLVLQSGVQGQGGEIFVLDMGKPVRIVDLARQLIELSGFEPERDIRIEFVGLRPGEKLFEELNLGEELCTPTAHPKIMRLRAEPQPFAVVKATLDQFSRSLNQVDGDELKSLLSKSIPEYKPASARLAGPKTSHDPANSLMASPRSSRIEAAEPTVVH